MSTTAVNTVISLLDNLNSEIIELKQKEESNSEYTTSLYNEL